MRETLLDALSRGRILVADGAMGTELHKEGLAPGGCGEAWNIERPASIRRIHARYLAAGSDVLLTNSFGGNRLRLALHGEAERARSLSRAAAELAREVVGDAGWVLGDMGPCGDILAPLGSADPALVHAAFLEQARALLAGGADGLIIETMTAIDELQTAVRAAREAGAGLVIASCAFDRVKDGGWRTMMGVTPEEACEAMLAAGVDVCGCNCGTNLGLADYAGIVRRYRAVTELPIMAQPNAGSPQPTRQGAVYDLSPSSLAAGWAGLVAAGAAVIGGCCGTTPAHIAAFRQRSVHEQR